MCKIWRKYPHWKKGYITFIIKWSTLNIICFAEESWQTKIQENNSLLENASLWKLKFGEHNLNSCFIKAEIFVLNSTDVPSYMLTLWLGYQGMGLQVRNPSAGCFGLEASARVCHSLRDPFPLEVWDRKEVASAAEMTSGQPRALWLHRSLSHQRLCPAAVCGVACRRVWGHVAHPSSWPAVLCVPAWTYKFSSWSCAQPSVSGP